MNFVRWSLLLAVMGLFSITGCEPAADDAGAGDSGATAASDSSTTTAEVAVLCGKCGENKTSEACCAEGEETCACGLHKDTPLCCVDLGEAAGKDICTGCGNVASADHTCPEDGEICENCELHKGSPGCCKLKS